MNSIEREFKTKISGIDYFRLMKKFELLDKAYVQENYYFDTPDFDLKNQDITIRIRIKDWSIHLTKKEKGENLTNEDTKNLSKDEANNLINNGMAFKGYHIENVASLKTTRAKTPYLDGVLFFDKNEYYNNVDYEIEYEINDNVKYEDGEKTFLAFLDENGITFQAQKSKSHRALEANKKSR